MHTEKFLWLLSAILIACFYVLGKFVFENFIHPVVLIHLILAMICILVAIIKTRRDGFIKFCKQVLGFLPIILLVIIVIILNYYFSQNNRYWDLTENSEYTLTQHEQTICKKFNSKVQVYIIRSPVQKKSQRALRLLDLYKSEPSCKLKIKEIDQLKDAELFRKYDIQSSALLLLTYDQQSTVLEDLDRDQFINALETLLKIPKLPAYYIIGHDEVDLTSKAGNGFKRFAEQLYLSGYEINPLLLSSYASIPTDAKLVILAAPKYDLSEAETKTLQTYLKDGGVGLLFYDPLRSVTFDQILKPFAIKTLPLIIAEPQQKLINGGENQLIVKNLKTSDMGLSNFSINSSILLTGSGMIIPESESNERRQYFSFMQSSPSATLLNLEGPQILKAPFTLGLGFNGAAFIEEDEQISWASANRNAKFLVFADTDWAYNAYLPQLGNRELLKSAFKWLNPNSIPAKNGSEDLNQGSIILISKGLFASMLLLSVVLFELLAILGLVSIYRRNMR